MPSKAPDWLRIKWGNDAATAMRFLAQQGYELDDNRNWIAPEINENKPTEEEMTAVNFLCLEYQYGTVVSKALSKHKGGS